MGTNATISMFDQSHWDHIFLPAAYDLFTLKHVRPWINDILEKHNLTSCELKVIKDFKNHCSVMDNFAAIDAGIYSRKFEEEKPRKFSDFDFDRRRCRDKDCQSNDHCPFYFKEDGEVQQDYGYFFWRIIESFLDPIHHHVFLGRNYKTASYRQILDENITDDNWKTRELLDKLGSRGFYIGVGTALNDGVHGWLNDLECKELSEGLRALDLQKLKATSENLLIKRPYADLVEDMKDFKEQEDPWAEYTLAYLQTFAEYAGRNGKGIVWINT